MTQLRLSQAVDIISKKLPQRIVLFPLVIRQEKDNFIVGIPETGKFVILPEVGIRVIKYLQKRYKLKIINRKIQVEYGKVNLKEFLISLVKLGYVYKIDDYEVKTEFNKNVAFSWIRPEHVSWIFSKPMYLLYSLIVSITVLTLIEKPWLFPSYHDFFWTDKTSIVILINLVISSCFVFLHELSHLIAARSRGIPSRFGLGTRLFLLVAKTDVSGVWTLPKKQRFRVYLAGIVCNLLIICLTFLLLAYLPITGIARNILKVVILINFLSLIPQFYLHIRMDIYYVLLNLLNCYNLFNDAKSYLKFVAIGFLQKLQRKPFSSTNPLLKLSIPEQKKIRIYAWFMGTGIVLSLYIFVLFKLPIQLITYWRGFISIRDGFVNNDLLTFSDGIMTILIRGVFLTLFIMVFINNHKKFLAKMMRAVIFDMVEILRMQIKS